MVVLLFFAGQLSEMWPMCRDFGLLKGYLQPLTVPLARPSSPATLPSMPSTRCRNEDSIAFPNDPLPPSIESAYLATKAFEKWQKITDMGPISHSCHRRYYQRLSCPLMAWKLVWLMGTTPNSRYLEIHVQNALKRCYCPPAEICQQIYLRFTWFRLFGIS